MAYSTCSHGSVSTDPEIEKAPVSKNIDDRERIIKRAELEDMQSLSQLLVSIQTDLSKLSHLPDQVIYLEQKICDNERHANEQTRASFGQDECGYNFPHQPIGQTMTASTLKKKVVISNIPNYNGYKISVFQFTRACARAHDLLLPTQEPLLV